MRQDFEIAYPIIRENEGYYANVKGDRGGRTYAGISEVNWPAWAGWAIIDKYEPCHWNQRIDDPELEQLVKEFYLNDLWPLMQGDEIESRPFVIYFADWFTNSQGKAVQKLQEILGVDQTGHFGPKTLAAVNGAGDDLLLKYHQRRIRFYNDHCNLVPADTKFLADWMRRATSTYELAVTYQTKTA